MELLMKDAYKIFKELEERNKRANPYKFYDKDELIDEILKDEDEIERLNNIINELEEYLNKVIETSSEMESITCSFVLKQLQELKGSDKE